MTSLQFLPPCYVEVPGTETSYSLTSTAVITATAGAIGALGARLFTHISPKLAGKLFAFAFLASVVGRIAMDVVNKPENVLAKALLASATGGLCAVILCHKTVVPLTVTSVVMFPIMTTVAAICGNLVAEQIIKDD